MSAAKARPDVIKVGL